MDDFSDFPTRLKELIKQSNMTQSQIADTIGISKHAFTKYLSGRIPEASILYSLSKFFGKSIEWLLTGEEIRTIVLDSRQQKNEVVFDPDLKMMIDILKNLMGSGDPDLRGWAKIQFKNAFKEHAADYASEKKQA